MSAKRLALLISKILCSAIVIISTNYVFAYDLEEYYPLAQGNSWTYLVIENEEIYERTFTICGHELVEDVRTSRFCLSKDEYRCMNIDDEGVKKYKYADEDSYGIFKPPNIAFPKIETGETKTYSSNLMIYNMDGLNIKKATDSCRILLECVEDIEVSSGKFNNCLKFSVTSEYKESGGFYSREDRIVWLAPGAGMVKELCYSSEYDPEAREEGCSVKIYELISAVIDGKKIGVE